MWETLEGAQELAIAQVDEYFDNLGEQGFYSDCLGEMNHFKSDSKSVQQISGQVTIGQQNLINKLMGLEVEDATVSWKTSSETICTTWTTEQIIKLGADLGVATQTLEHNRELVVDAIENATSVEEIKTVLENLK